MKKMVADFGWEDDGCCSLVHAASVVGYGDVAHHCSFASWARRLWKWARYSVAGGRISRVPDKYITCGLKWLFARTVWKARPGTGATGSPCPRLHRDAGV